MLIVLGVTKDSSSLYKEEIAKNCRYHSETILNCLLLEKNYKKL